MLARVQQHIGEHRPHLPRCSQDPFVIATVEHRPLASEDSIHCPRNARPNALHPASEGRRSLGFDEHVDVIVLDRVVNDAKPAATNALAERTLDLTYELDCAQ
jgi:hypothetical protein